MNLRKYSSVAERRISLEKETQTQLTHTGQFSLDEKRASTHNCENMIGVTQVPMGVAGPLQISSLKFGSKNYYIPLSTTEGVLVASVNRGCKAITEGGVAVVNSHRIGVTRGPVFYTGGVTQNQKFFDWIKSHEKELAETAESSSRHLVFKKAKVTTVGKYAYVRFSFDTQDAMGMNMVTFATQKMVELIELETHVRCLSLSGNFCVDKKVSWQNFLNHRGIKVWAEAVLSHKVLTEVLKTTAQDIYQVWLAKCMLGSVMSGSIGFNAQAANVIAALFLATGQDLGHVGEGSMAVTTAEIVKRKNSREDLYISVYLPDMMVGTVGGGTKLATQSEALQLLGVAGGDDGKNSERLAEVVGAAVLAGEISLLSSLEEGSLATAHRHLARGGTV